MINTALLSVENSPDIQIPYRFLRIAPLFGVLFGVLVMWLGTDLLQSRWTPQVIGVFHLFNIGVLMMITTGVLFQMLPVLSGVHVPQQRLIAMSLYLLMTVGTLLYAVGFIWGTPLLIKLASVALAIGLIPYVLVLVWTLFRLPSPPEPVLLLRYASIFLLLLVVLGVLLLFEWSRFGVASHRQWTDIHAIWGLGGWFTLLLMGVSFQMIPMFQVTPEFPRWVRRWIIPICALSLLSWGAITMAGGEAGILLIVTAMGMVTYSVTALQVLMKRRRKISDTTVNFWRFALAALGGGSITLLVSVSVWGAPPDWLALFWLFCVLLPMISGTLMKIAPFLVFIHLQQQAISKPQQPGLVQVPNLYQILPVKWVKHLWKLYLVLVTVGLATFVESQIIYLTGLLLFLYFSWMGWIVYRCYHVYNTRA